MQLILASASPRRRELLAQLGLQFQIAAANVDESTGPNELADEAAVRLARAKAEAVATQFPDGVVIAADTLVTVEDRILGKPRNAAESEAHLRQLSGRTHQVVTGVYVIDVAAQRSASGVEVTEVDFDLLSEAEIRWYVESREGLDKAGSYGYQGLASALINGIRGCYFNVVGLPLSKLRRLMNELGHDLLVSAGESAVRHPDG